MSKIYVSTRLSFEKCGSSSVGFTTGFYSIVKIQWKMKRDDDFIFIHNYTCESCDFTTWKVNHPTPCKIGYCPMCGKGSFPVYMERTYVINMDRKYWKRNVSSLVKLIEWINWRHINDCRLLISFYSKLNVFLTYSYIVVSFI